VDSGISSLIRIRGAIFRLTSQLCGMLVHDNGNAGFQKLAHAVRQNARAKGKARKMRTFKHLYVPTTLA
ncbi:hypothetical protein CWC09_18975, partial [Pseudoalteromonas ruthenica]